MAQIITLTLPDTVYQQVARTAQATNQSLETVLLTALRASLPALDELPDAMQQELVAMEYLDNQALRQTMLAIVPLAQQQALEDLLARSKTGALTVAEQTRLAALQQGADLVMLRKAWAAVLLRFRGERIPTQDELYQLTTQP